MYWKQEYVISSSKVYSRVVACLRLSRLGTKHSYFRFQTGSQLISQSFISMLKVMNFWRITPHWTLLNGNKKPYELKELTVNLRRVKKKTMIAQGIAFIIAVYTEYIGGWEKEPIVVGCVS